jgi:hypothetical protein
MYVRGPISASTLLVVLFAACPATAAAGDSTCTELTPSDLPVRLPPGAAGARVSNLEVAVGGIVESVEILALAGRHTDTSELTFHLRSPQATSVNLTERCLGAPGINFDLQLSDDAVTAPPCPMATDGGTYSPAEPLSTLAGESLQGTWTLTVFGHVHGNGGWLDSWKLHVCYSTAPDLAIDPDPLDLGEVLVGTTSAPASVSLSNPGTATLTIAALGTATAPFAEAGGSCGAPPIELAPGAECTLDYTFSPSAVVAASDSIAVTSDAAAGPTSFGLAGTGVQPELAIDPDPLDFGRVLAGSTGDTRSASFSNPGTATLNISAVSAAGAPFAEAGGTCGAPHIRRLLSSG